MEMRIFLPLGLLCLRPTEDKSGLGSHGAGIPNCTSSAPSYGMNPGQPPRAGAAPSPPAPKHRRSPPPAPLRSPGAHGAATAAQPPRRPGTKPRGKAARRLPAGDAPAPVPRRAAWRRRPRPPPRQRAPLPATPLLRGLAQKPAPRPARAPLAPPHPAERGEARPGAAAPPALTRPGASAARPPHSPPAARDRRQRRRLASAANRKLRHARRHFRPAVSGSFSNGVLPRGGPPRASRARPLPAADGAAARAGPRGRRGRALPLQAPAGAAGGSGQRGPPPRRRCPATAPPGFRSPRGRQLGGKPLSVRRGGENPRWRPGARRREEEKGKKTIIQKTRSLVAEFGC